MEFGWILWRELGIGGEGKMGKGWDKFGHWRGMGLGFGVGRRGPGKEIAGDGML